MTTFGYMEANSMAWLVTIPAVAIENLVALVIISSRKRWKSPDVLLFSITLGHLLSLLLPLLLYAVITFTKTPWSDGSCKFLVWCVMSFRIVGAVNIAFISLDRVWTLKWPSSYRSHNSSRQTARTAVFMWLFGVAIGTIPLISWSNLEVNQTCSLVLNIAGYGYAMCIVIIILGSVIISTGCICTIVVNVAFVWPLLEESSDPKDTIPHIVIESETGERTSAVVGSRDSQNKQIYYLVSTVVVLYFCINGLPFVVINIIAFTEDVPSYWMSVTISWCSVVSAFLHPPLLVLLCNRYKKVCVRFFRYIGESCGCTHVTPARPSLNGITRQETFDSLDDFSSDEDDKLHFPSPDWSDRSFTGSFDETPGPSSQPTIEVTAPTTTNSQTVTVVEHSQVVQNGKIPPKKSQKTPLQSGKYTPRSYPDAVSPTKTAVEYDNAAFVVEDENKKGKSKKQRSPKLTPEQKRAIWQGHKGARKRLEALKQASAERGSSSSSRSSKGKKTRSKTRQEKREKDADKIMKDNIPDKNKHKRLERISTRQHSLDSLTVPTKRRAPMLSSRSFDQPDNKVTIKVDIENSDRQNNFTDFLREEKKKSISVKTVKSEGETSRGKKKRKKPEKKEDRADRKENFKKDNVDNKLQRDQKLTVSPNSSPSAHERRKTDGNSLRGPRFEIARENYNSDFSSFGSGELYDIPEESPEEIMVESSGWSPSTVRAIRTQHRNELEPRSDCKNRDGNTVPRKHKERERPRPRSKLDRTEPGLQVKDKRPTKGLLSRQLSQDHSRTPEVNSIEMTELGNPGSVENIPFGHLHDNNDEMSFNEHKAFAETAMDADQSKYYTSEDLLEKHVKQGGVEREHSILEDHSTDLPADAGHPREEAKHRGFTLHTQAWASLSSPPGKTLTELEEVPSEQKGHLSKSRSTGDRPSAKDLRERYRKSHLSMAAIFESIQDDSQEVVYL